MTVDNTAAHPPLDRSTLNTPSTLGPTPYASVNDSAKWLNVSRSQLVNLLDAGRIDSRYLGRRRLVVVASLEAFATGLPTERED